MGLARYLFAQLALEAAPEKRQDIVVEQLIHERRKRIRAMAPLSPLFSTVLHHYLLFYTLLYLLASLCILGCDSKLSWREGRADR